MLFIQSISKLIGLYLTLVRSQLMYCTPIWCPYLQKDIQSSYIRACHQIYLKWLESNYKTQLKFLPLCICLNFKTSFLLLNHLAKYSTKGFNILHHISFSTSNHIRHPTISFSIFLIQVNRHSFFHWLPRLWNAIPVIDLHLSISTIKIMLK